MKLLYPSLQVEVDSFFYLGSVTCQGETSSGKTVRLSTKCYQSIVDLCTGAH